MKVKEIIETVNELKPNKYTDENKIAWISQLDGKINDELIRVYNDSVSSVLPYRDVRSNVIAPARYKMLYVFFVCAQIDIFNNEIELYNNNMINFNNEYSLFQRAYIREHKSKGRFKI